MRVRAVFDAGAQPPRGRTPAELAGAVFTSENLVVQPAGAENGAPPWTFDVTQEIAQSLLSKQLRFAGQNVTFAAVETPVEVTVIGDGFDGENVLASTVVQAALDRFKVQLAAVPGQPGIFLANTRAEAMRLFAEPILIGYHYCHFVESAPPTAPVVDAAAVAPIGSFFSAVPAVTAGPLVLPTVAPIPAPRTRPQGIAAGPALSTMDNAPALAKLQPPVQTQPHYHNVNLPVAGLPVADLTPVYWAPPPLPPPYDAATPANGFRGYDAGGAAAGPAGLLAQPNGFQQGAPVATADTTTLTRPALISIFHDAENCYIPHNPNISGIRLYSNIIRESLRLYWGPQLAAAGLTETQIDVHRYTARWRLALSDRVDNLYRPHSKTLEELRDFGVDVVVTSSKPGSVDIAIKGYLDDFLNNRKHTPENERKMHPIVLLAGDRDYNMELQRIRQAGFPLIVIHRHSARLTIADIARVGDREMSSDVWDQLVSSATIDRASLLPGPSQIRSLPFPAAPLSSVVKSAADAESGTVTPILPPSPSPAPPSPVAPGPAAAVLSEQYIQFPTKLYLEQVGLNELRQAVELDDNLTVEVNTDRPGATFVRLKVNGARPSKEIVNRAIAALQEFLSRIRTEATFEIGGVTRDELMRNTAVLQEARRKKVLIFIPKGTGAAAVVLGRPGVAPGIAAAAAGPARQPGQDNAAAVRLQVCVPKTWKDNDIKRFCLEQHNLHVFNCLPPAPLPPNAVGNTYSWVGLQLDTAHHPQASREQLVADLEQRPAYNTRGSDGANFAVRFRRYKAHANEAPPAGSAAPPRQNAGNVASPPRQNAGNAAGAAAPPNRASVTLVTLDSEDATVRLNSVKAQLHALARSVAVVPIKEGWKLHLFRNRSARELEPQPGGWLRQVAQQFSVDITFVTTTTAEAAAPPGRPAHAGERSARATNVEIRGQVDDVERAVQSVRNGVNNAVMHRTPIPADKWKATVLALLARKRRAIFQDLFNTSGDGGGRGGSAGAEPDVQAGGAVRPRLQSARRQQDVGAGDSNDNDDSDDEDGGGGGGDTDAIRRRSAMSLSVQVPRLDDRAQIREIRVSALAEWSADAQTIHDALKGALATCEVTVLTIPPKARDIGQPALRKMEEEFNVATYFNPQERRLELAGAKADIQDARAQITESLQGAQQTTTTFKATPPELGQLLRRWPKLAFADVSAVQTQFPNVVIRDAGAVGDSHAWRLSGPRAAVDAVVQRLSLVCSQLAARMATQQQGLTTPQFQFLLDGTHTHLRPIADATSTLVQLLASSSANPRSPSNGVTRPAMVPGTKSGPQVLGEGTIGPLKVKVISTDLLQLRTSAVVNPANTNLGNEGGLARAIANAAGPQLAAACRSIAPVPVGTARSTSSFSLAAATANSIHTIVHAVAPVCSTASAEERALLRQAVRAAMTTAAGAAATPPLTSLAIPLIGSGLYQWDVNVAAAEIVAALQGVVIEGAIGKLIEVVLFDNRPVAVTAFVNAMSRARDGAPAAAAAASLTGIPSVAVLDRRPVPTHQWDWKNDAKVGVPMMFMPYDYAQNEQLEQAYQRHQSAPGTSSALVRITGDTDGQFSDSKHIPEGYEHPVYDVDIQRMRQVNVKSKFEREVRRRPLIEGELPPLTPNDVRYSATQGSNHALPGPITAAHTAQAVPAVFFQTTAAAVPIDSRGGSDTGSLKADGATALDPAATASPSTVSDSAPTSAASPCIQIFGEPAAVDRARTLVAAMLEAAVKTEYCPVDDLVDLPLQQILARVSPQLALQGATVEAASPSAASSATAASQGRMLVVRAYGAAAVAQASREVVKVLSDLIAEAVKIRYPPEWVPMGNRNGDDDDGAAQKVFYDVPANSAEYARISAEFAMTGQGYTITKIERVQNKHMWQRYWERRRQILRENGGDAKEVYMKHGSRSTSPNTICVGQFATGFDFRYAATTSYYGVGAYFAERTAYSHSYRYQLAGTPNQAQMFIGLVACGKVDDRTARGLAALDKNIRHPPPGYHSIRAMVQETDPAVIVYDNNQAYPAYLVTYTY